MLTNLKVLSNKEKVYKLNKALYRLKQAPRTWFNRIESYFKRKDSQKAVKTIYSVCQEKIGKNDHGMLIC